MTRKLSISTKLIVTVSSLISITLVVFIAITANYYITRMSENNNELYVAYRVSENIKTLRTCVITLDGSQRRYMLTGDARNLELYKLKETEAKTLLKKLERYFDGRQQEGAFDRLKDLTYKILLEAKELKHGGDLTGLQTLSNNREESSKTVEEINKVIDEITTGLSQTTRQLIGNSVEYLAVSKKWNLLEILLGVIVALAGVIILFRDINLRNQLEIELRNAKKQAEENAMMKEQFMANMSHEIRTPMNAILGFSELLSKTNLDKTQTDYLAAISSSGGTLLTIINDILDFSKINAGKLKIEKIPFSLRELLDAMNLIFESRAAEKGIKLQMVVEEKVPDGIIGDPTRLNQVLVNLLGNAIKFTHKGTVTLRCELLGTEQEVARLLFRITDTGIGIPADKIDEIFERFNQGQKETTRNYGGTGLGLSIVKSLVEMQNGTVKVKSRRGQGSEFTVVLSYHLSGEKRRLAGVEAVQRLPALANNDKVVLLAEDNVLNQKLAINYLNGFGLRAEVAANGFSALSMLGSKSYDLVLMDIQMPIMDGYETTKKLRKELGLTIPVIAMTAHVVEGEREKCVQCGMNDYISKPFRESELHTVLSLHLGNGQPAERISNADALVVRQGVSGVVDFQELIELSRGNKAFIREMIEIFLAQNPADLVELEDAVESGNFEVIRASAHRMKTSMGFMGLKSLVETMNQVEMLAGKKTGLEDIKNKMRQVKRDCGLAAEEFKDRLVKL